MNDSTDAPIVDDPVARRMLYALVIDDAGDPSPDPPGVGTRTPEVWLVADRLPSKARSTVPLHTAAGRALVWPEVDPERHRVSNATGVGFVHSLTRLRERWEALGRPATVALGSTAAVAFERIGVPLHGRLSHPQFVWRFHQGDAHTYRANLRALLDAVRAAPPRIERAVEESAEVRAVRARLAAAPGKFLVARSGLERADAHNLTRRLRRAGDLRVLMRRLRDGSYAVLVRDLTPAP